MVTKQENWSKNVNSGKSPTALLFDKIRASLREEKQVITKTKTTQFTIHSLRLERLPSGFTSRQLLRFCLFSTKNDKIEKLFSLIRRKHYKKRESVHTNFSNRFTCLQTATYFRQRASALSLIFDRNIKYFPAWRTMSTLTWLQAHKIN